MTEIIATTDDGHYRLRMVIDPDPANPREEYDHITYALTVPHTHYADVEAPGPLAEQWDRIKDRPDAVAVFIRWAETFLGAMVESHTPERGPNSVWYMLPAQFAEVTDPREALRQDIDAYQSWADGDVYGYIIEESVTWKRTDGDETRTTWEEVESCWGFIGYEHATSTAKEAFADYVKTA